MPVDLLRDGLLRARDGPERSLTDEMEAWAAWVRPEAEAGDAAPEPRTPPTGPCALCKERPAEDECLQCHRGVCSTDRWVMLGLCRECLTEKELRRAREAPAKRRPDLDIKWVED